MLREAEMILDDDHVAAVAIAWIERTLGGKVVSFERQARWRPAWFADMKVGDALQRLYVRAPKKTGHNSLAEMKHDYTMHRLLEEGGVKVPHLFGFIEEIGTMVMEQVAGRSDLRHAASEADREAVRRQLVREMARMHRLDTAPFIAAGFDCPTNPLETTLAGLRRMESGPSSARPTPNPHLAFLLGWVRRNAPPAKTAPKVTAYDAGQFMYDGPLLTALLDFETAMLGDPLQDLAILRRRTTYEPMGDIPALFRMYEEETGEAIDRERLYIHTVISSAAAVVGSSRHLANYLAAPGDDGDYVQYLSWVCNSTKQGFEGLAEASRYRVPALNVPEPAVTLARDALIAARATASGLDQADPYSSYRRRTLLDNIAYMERVVAYGGPFATDYLDAAAGVLGARPRDVAEADRLFEAYVLQAGPEEDERLFEILCADILRRSFLLAVPDSTYSDGLTKPVQPFV